LAQQAQYARAVLNGILRECDATQMINKKQNIKTENNLKTAQANMETDIENWNSILYDIDEAQQAGDCPVWDDVNEDKQVATRADEEIFKDVKEIQKNVDVLAKTEMIQYDMKNRKIFKPAQFHFDADVHKFMIKNNPAYRKVINDPPEKSKNLITLKKEVY